jgi:hypothetical protein
MVSPADKRTLEFKARLLDEQENHNDRNYLNVVSGCISGAELAEHIAWNLMRDAEWAVEDENLTGTKENIENYLDLIDQLKIIVTAARWRREIPDVFNGRTASFMPEELQKILNELSHY